MIQGGDFTRGDGTGGMWSELLVFKKEYSGLVSRLLF